MQIPEIDRLPRRAIRIDRPLNRHFTAVVSGDGEQPVTVELIVECLQIFERGTGRLDDVAPPVVPPDLFQPETGPGVGNELPQAGGTRARESEGLEGTLDHRKEGNLERHPTRFELRDDMV